ncbi:MULTISPECIES: MacB family efflux pump subunit [unclassified Sphingobium]|uniref:MacB family efflux pump subunit n=1 Tax=unclassified Sphingobium TaxID=2611147 RepID=UPI0022248AFD|nr:MULTISPECIES: MacB family efflux pump subunit [unclassified Sphingobium]MCW2395758.1 macrolide transport system ATP-binding/permease protein [Sphingobium sp. B8D3B]MCW2419273.1 macrolide transport system ATP-binding/permease protein [Sphingobium sp. B8D3C]
MTMPPIIETKGLRREFPAGEGTVAVLKDIDLTIHAGELVAIVGASGSGKSTLMNILGCLDRPTSGSYRVQGRDTGTLAPDELAALRREHFGFIFQRYHLLSDLSALGNVEVPSIYAGRDPTAQRERALALLARLGLGERTRHLPGQLSGGQQQRVSIARALMNGGAIILADEPTGALDKASGEEVMRILQELNAEGHTIILVTHDMAVAGHADRIIEISDGVIVADRYTRKPSRPQDLVQAAQPPAVAWRAAADRFSEAFRMALLAMAAHRMRTFLTMLGIIIGIASVVSVVALGNGAQSKVMAQISDLGTNTIDIFPGQDFGDLRAASIQTLSEGDARVLAGQTYVDSVSPNVSTSVTARRDNIAATAQINGVGAGYFRVRGFKVAQGTLFKEEDVARSAQVAVIDTKARTTLFPHGANPIGATVLLGQVPVRVIGVLRPSQAGGGGSSANIYIPYSTAATRMTGRTKLESITVRVADHVTSNAAQEAVTTLLTRRHGTKDFFIFNSDQIRKAITQTSQTLTLLISSIAVIALVVGGIGVMNIMLVSVTERTREIGVRMAVGARQSDILQQFLIEAVLVCLIGGAVGVLMALLLGLVVRLTGSGFEMVFSLPSILLAFACSTGIGILFGFLPARNAARLDPVEALARD